MTPTDVTDPRYYHKVVDCQWACPAHTNVPEYLRLIAQGRYSDSYLLNRESNVFPGILGRTCDRPCEPACRRPARAAHRCERPDAARLPLRDLRETGATGRADAHQHSRVPAARERVGRRGRLHPGYGGRAPLRD